MFHDNLELNRLCIESVFCSTDWPNYELLLVDNASTDGSREYAQQVAAEAAKMLKCCSTTAMRASPGPTILPSARRRENMWCS